MRSLAAARPVLALQDLTGQPRPGSAFLMRCTNPSHWDEVNLSSAPEWSRESLTSTDESNPATSTHAPLPPLVLLLCQISVEFRFG